MSRQREWALRAHKCVKVKKDELRKDDKLLKSYNTHCKKGPSLLQRAGAMQGLAFLYSRDKDNDAGRDYVEDLAEIYYGKKERGEKLLDRAKEQEFSNYLQLSQDLLTISAWLRRFAQIELADVKVEG